jgi:peptidoglycan-associated lipoprotein
MKVNKLLPSALVLALTLCGCGTRGGVAGDGAKTTAGRPSATNTGQYGQSRTGGGVAGAYGDLDSATGPLSQRVIYFAYDSDDVLPEYQPVVTAHAGYLAAHAGQSAVLEGHADERGSSEYNIALAERRARSVERSLRLQGAGGDQLQIVSYGEEKPAVAGHEESSWQQNRRVEIVYSGH